MPNLIGQAIVAIQADLAQFKQALQAGQAGLKGFARAGQGMSRALDTAFQGVAKGTKTLGAEMAKAGNAAGKGFQKGLAKFLGPSSSMGLREFSKGLSQGLSHALKGFDKALLQVSKGLSQGILRNSSAISRGMEQGFQKSFQAIGIASGVMANRVGTVFRVAGAGAAGTFRGMAAIAGQAFQAIAQRAQASMARVQASMAGAHRSMSASMGMMARGGLRGAIGHGVVGALGGIGIATMMGPGGAAMAAGAAATGGLRTALVGASTLNETVNKLGVIFGDQARIVVAGADEMAERFGIVRTEFMDAASEIGNLLQQMGGMGEEQAAKLSVSLSQAAANASSLFNTSFGEASEKIQAAIRGMSRPISSFGINTQEAAVKQEALRMGLVKGTRELTMQEKVAARTSLVLRGLNVAQGDLANTASSFANVTRAISGRWQNLMASLGQSLMPIAEGFLGAINRMLGGLEGFLGAAKPQLEGFGQGFVRVAEYAKWMAGQVGEALGGHLAYLRDSIAEWSVYQAAVQAVGTLWNELKAIAAETFEAIGVVFRNWSSIVAEATVRAKGYLINIGELFGWLLGIARSFLGWYADNFTSIWVDGFTATLTAMGNFATNVQNLFTAIWEYVNGKGFHFDWTPLLEGFKATMSALPEVAAPALSSVQNEIDAIRLSRDRDIQGQEDKRVRDRRNPNAAANLVPVRGERLTPEANEDPDKAAKAAKKKREGEEAVYDAKVSVRRAREDFLVHMRGEGGGQIKGLTQFAQDIQTGALSTGDFQRRALRLFEDMVKAQRELYDATIDQGHSVNVAAP